MVASPSGYCAHALKPVIRLIEFIRAGLINQCRPDRCRIRSTSRVLAATAVLLLFHSSTIAQPPLIVSEASLTTVGPNSPNLLLIGNSNDRTALFQSAIEAAARWNKILFLQGDIRISSTISIPSDAIIIGMPGHSPVVRNHQRSMASLFYIAPDAENVSLHNFQLLEGPRVLSSIVLLGGKNRNIEIGGIEFLGRNVLENVSTAGILLANDYGEQIFVHHCDFRNLQYGVHTIAPVHDLRINNNCFRGWTNYAIRNFVSRANNARRIKNVQISGNLFTSPARGSIKTMILVSGGFGNFALNVDITHNRAFGPGLPWIRGAENSNNATTDQIIVHKTNRFRISDNFVIGGGENGITASRLSRNGVISRNRVIGNDGNGISVGSGFALLTLSRTSELSIGNQVTGADSGTTGIVDGIEGNTIGVKRVIGGNKFLNERLINETTGQVNAASILINDRTKKILVVDNLIYDNGRNLENVPHFKFAGILIKDSDSIELRRNRIFNSQFEDGIVTQDFGINLSNSRNICVAEDNVFEQGAQSLEQGLQMNSSSWLCGQR